MLTDPPVILSPLRMEASPLRALAHQHGWIQKVSGIGAEAVTAAAQSAPGQGIVVLAGVAGALRREIQTGTAHHIREVHGPDGIIQAPLVDHGLRVTGADAIIATPQDKLDLAERTGADLVDMESHAFAAQMQALGRPWAIIRGVSDGVDHHLPAGCDRWFTAGGSLRIHRAAWDLLKRPGELPQLMAFAGRTRSAMRSVARLLDTFLHKPRIDSIVEKEIRA